MLTALPTASLEAPRAFAQARFFERPIEIVVGFTAGGGTDVMARIYGRFAADPHRAARPAGGHHRPQCGRDRRRAGGPAHAGAFGRAPLALRANAPTYRELGLDVEMSSERGIMAPAVTPPAILQRLREATDAIAADAEFIRGMEGLFTAMRHVPGERWAEEIRGRQAACEALWRRNPWRERG